MSDHGNFTITASRDGTRQIGRNAYMDREGTGERWSPRNQYRGRSRGGYRGRNNRRSGNYRRGGNYQHDDRTVNPRSRLDEDEDGDIAMEGGSHRSNYRYNPYGGGRGRGRGSWKPRGNTERGGGVHSRLGNTFQPQGSWFRISIPGGREHDQTWLVNKLQKTANCTFQPVESHYFKGDFVFFLEDPETAEALKKVSSRITCRDGSKITVIVRSSAPPRITKPEPVELDEGKEQTILGILAPRFNSTENYINLSNLLDSGGLKEAGITMAAVLEVIHSKCPNIRGLDMSNNNLHSLDVLKQLHVKTPKLEILILKDNRIRYLNELRKIERLTTLQTLDLRGNTAATNFTKFESYASEVRAFLPKLLTLDGELLPKPITFDLPTETNIPQSVPSFVPDSKVASMITAFVTQYISSYDKDDRQELLDIYHDQAVFSLSVNMMLSRNTPQNVRNALSNHLKFSRNLKRLSDKERRSMLIKNKRLSAVGLLNDLPRTKHRLETFQLDVTVVRVSSLCFTIRGIFVDVETTAELAFTRTFMAVPATTDIGMKIINDQLHIRAMTSKQAESQAGSSQGSMQPVASSPFVSKDSSQTEQEKMAQKFSAESNMKMQYAVDCLQQNNWDYAKAAEVFTQLKREGKIPPDAFLS